MKRAPALQPLSRDHLKALMTANAVRKATDAAAAIEAFRAFWAREHTHFRLEEEILLPAWAANGPVDEPAVQRMLADHLAIRAMALRLERERPPLTELRALGTRLYDHVRFEERVLFPAVERALDEAALDALGARLQAAEPSP